MHALLLALLALFVPGAPTPKPGPAPVVKPGVARPSVRVVAARRTPPLAGVSLAKYVDGPISYDLQIENTGGGVARSEVVVYRLLDFGNVARPEWGEVVRIPVELDTGAKKWSTFVLPEGLRNGGCNGFTLRVELGDGPAHYVYTQPTCELTGMLVDDSAAGSDAQRDSMRADRIFILTASFTKPPQCHGRVAVLARVENRTDHSARATLRLMGRDTKFDLDEHSSPTQTVEGYDFVDGREGRHGLSIAAKDGFPKALETWHVDITRKCKLTVSLEPADDSYDKVPT